MDRPLMHVIAVSTRTVLLQTIVIRGCYDWTVSPGTKPNSSLDQDGLEWLYVPHLSADTIRASNLGSALSAMHPSRLPTTDNHVDTKSQ